MNFEKLLLAVSVSAAAICSAPVLAETPQETAARFAMRPAILDISLSPSGDKIAYIAPNGDRGEALFVVDLAKGGAPTPLIANSEDGADLTNCDWATETHLVCEVYIIRSDGSLLLGFDRIVSVDASTGKVLMLSQKSNWRTLRVSQDGGSVVALDVPDEENQILMTRDWVAERTTGTNMANTREGLGVDRIDITSGRRKSEVRPDKDAAWYVADQFGNVRLKMTHPVHGGTGMLKDERHYYFRAKNQSSWQKFSSVTVDSQTASGFRPVAVDGALDVAYGYGSKDGFDAIYRVSLKDPGEPELVAAKEGAEVDHLIRIGRQRRVVGVSYSTEKPYVEYFDPAIEKIAAGLQAALPGKPLINMIDASADEAKLMIVAASDVDPGMIYLLDRSAMQLEPVLPVRHRMDAAAMAEMKPISFPAADGTMIPGYLTLPKGSSGKGLKAIVLPHGGPSARDYWGFDWLVQYFAARGYAVLQPNYRGSSGYGEAWFGRNGFQDWKVAIGDVNDAGRWLVKEGITTPAQLGVVGWSYGGYAALQSQALDPDLYKAVVAIAPVTDLEMLRDHARNFTNANLVRDFVGEGDHVRAGSPAQNVDSVRAPVLLFHGTLDQNVDVSQSRFMERKLKEAGKGVTYVEFDGLDHQLDEAKARYRMLTDIDDFLSRNLGG